MLKSSARPVIRLRGVRQNNLKNFDLDLPLNHLIVITGLSGSGKSSLAFDTLFAEGQRRYIETFSPYARQFFDRMDKPQVDSIEGIPPAIAIEQRNAVRTTRSTVGTMTEICDYLKLLWPHVAQLHCRQCGRPVRKDSPQEVWHEMLSKVQGPKSNAGEGMAEVLVTFDVPLSEKLPLDESLALIAKQGYQRLLVAGNIVRLEEAQSAMGNQQSKITVVQDRIKLTPANRSRFVEACEQAYHFGKGRLTVHELASGSPGAVHLFSNRFHCAACDIDYREPTPALFSFNHPIGACPTCKGFGRVISIDYNLALPDRSRTLAEGVVKPWLTGHGLESQNDLMRACRHFEIPTDVPFEKLAPKWQKLVIEGEPDYGIDEEHEWPRAWYGVKGYFRWLESKAYKMHVRVLLSRYRSYTLCSECGGARFQPEALLYLLPPAVGGDRLSLADFYALPIRDSLKVIDSMAAARKTKPRSSAQDPIALVLAEARSRLGFLNEVGLGYLTLDRPTRSLSGGETERVNLTTCLGTRLVNTLFILDEPSVGLHPRDTERLVRVLEQLRNAGNTVVVVEHEAAVMRAADRIIDIGPGHGAAGGEVVFNGTGEEIVRSEQSLTGKYLSGRMKIELPERRPVVRADAGERDRSGESTFMLNEVAAPFGNGGGAGSFLNITGATRNNLQDVSVAIPLNRFVCVTGVSGSGKTTLIREIVLPALEENLRSQISNLKFATVKASERIEPPAPGTGAGGADENDDDGGNTAGAASLSGANQLGRVVLVDQSSLGKTPRSNPAVYIGAFDDIREFFAQSEMAKRRGLNASAFSFNSGQGQCERCRGAGFEKIEMQFLSDVFIRCPDCDGRRYREHILEVKVRRPETQSSKFQVPGSKAEGRARSRNADAGWSIADLLDATVDEAIEFLRAFPDLRPAQRAADSLELLQEVGLGFLRLGQPINTLSGGESQRLKLVRHLAEAAVDGRPGARPSTLDPRPTLFLFDEPTTGLHFDDVRVLLKVFQRLVDAGHSVIVIEHNLDVIKSADWLIDLGPGAGDEGGKVVAQGTPEDVATCEESFTGRFLRDVLPGKKMLNARARRRAGRKSGVVECWNDEVMK
jgi:excinuclease ABC subunit A